jgi:hypothetical protein
MELAGCLHQFLCQKEKRPGDTNAVSFENRLAVTLPVRS